MKKQLKIHVIHVSVQKNKPNKQKNGFCSRHWDSYILKSELPCALQPVCKTKFIQSTYMYFMSGSKRLIFKKNMMDIRFHEIWSNYIA